MSVSERSNLQDLLATKLGGRLLVFSLCLLAVLAATATEAIFLR